MLDQLKENIERHIKTHTERSDDDRSAVTVLGTFLRSNGRINMDFASDDKWPNHDGTFEFVPDPDISRQPKQNFFVQIKGTRNYTETDGVVKYTLKDLAFPAFICGNVSNDPGILFVVLNPSERGEERVFWKYMSVKFLNSIDFSKNSVTIGFLPEEEIKNSDKSIQEFCASLKNIVEHHSLINQLNKHSYTIEDVEKIINYCNEEITENIENFYVLNKTRDDISKRILTKLFDLCSSVLLLNTIHDGHSYPDVALAFEQSLFSVETKFLCNFFLGLYYIDMRIPENGQSERLMLKYYNFLWQIKKMLFERYNISILDNLEKFHQFAKSDDQDEQYYKLVADAFYDANIKEKHKSDTRFYIQKKTPFFVGEERYFELTLQQAGMYTSKFNRITAYTKIDISTDYPIKFDFFNANMKLWGIDTKIKIITKWKVSIDPRCLNKLGKILKIPTNLSSKYGEYDELMDFLTRTGMNFLEMIDLKKVNFLNVLEDIYKNSKTKHFKEILEKLRNNFYKGSNINGKYTVRYLLIDLREELLERILPFGSNMKNDEVNLSKKCYPFERNPLISNLAGSKTSTINHARKLARVVEREKVNAAIPYWTIMKSIENEGELYLDIDSELTISSIQNYNNKLDSWEKKQGYEIIIDNYTAYINSYEKSTLFILEKLLELSHLPNKGQKEFNANYLKQIDTKPLNVDEQKIEALKNAFVKSRVFLIYGAAGTGKTMLIDMISSMMKDNSKLFLTKTHSALQNLKRMINNPGTNSSFVSIDSFTRKEDLTKYDIIFVDECSTIDNKVMKKLLEKMDSDTFLVLAGDIYQIESIEFGNWFSYAKDIITSRNGLRFSKYWRGTAICDTESPALPNASYPGCFAVNIAARLCVGKP